MRSDIKALYEKKGRIYRQMKDAMTKSREAGKIDKEDEVQFEAWNKEYDQTEAMIKAEEKLLEMDGEYNDKFEEVKKEKPVDHAKRYAEVFEKYIRFGATELSHDEKLVLSKGAANLTDAEQQRAATPSSTSVATGGYTIPEGFSNELEMAMEYTGPFTMANGPYRAVNTASGNKIPWPTIDDTANDGFLQTEATEDAQDSSTGLTFSEEELDSYVYNSGVIPVSIQLAQDSAFPFGSLVGEACGQRLGRTVNYYATVGTGNSQPEGAVIGATQGKLSASATAITHDEIIDLVASVNRAYRNPSSPKVGFQLHSLVEAEVRKLDASASNYTQAIWQPSFASDVPSTILGYRYWINDDMDSALTTGKKVMLFGDFNKFVIRRVGGVTIFRFNERFMEKLLVAYMGWVRFDSVVIQTKAIKYYELT